jgi:hypothetical protein
VQTGGSVIENDVTESHPVNVQLVIQSGIVPMLIDTVKTKVDIAVIQDYQCNSPLFCKHWERRRVPWSRCVNIIRVRLCRCHCQYLT